METRLESTSRQPAAEHLNENVHVELSKKTAGEICRNCLKIYTYIFKVKGQSKQNFKQRTFQRGRIITLVNIIALSQLIT